MNFIWNLIAKVLATPAIANWVINRAYRTPYRHITSGDGQDVYMKRYWLFNPYETSTGERPRRNWLMERLPSMRVHVIRRADHDQHLHDHPWDARTFILRNWYREERLCECDGTAGQTCISVRTAGATSTLNYGEYHRIAEVAPDGVFTLFVTFKYIGTWGFLVDGQKVEWREYLGIDAVP